MSEVQARIKAILARDDGRESKAARMAEAIREYGGYRWVGIYDVEEHEVAILGWSGGGAPAHPRFPRTKGLTSAAIESVSSVVVNDVASDPRYLDAFGDTRAEMIMPVVDAGDVVGTIDVESDRTNAFGADDVALLESCAAAARPLWLRAPTRYGLPPDLPVPVDDGACDHLLGQALPALTLESSQGPVDLAELARERLVLYVYPGTGRPGQPVPAGWDEIPGARGCTPESCGFRDHAAELAGLGARVAGLSAQPLEEQLELADRNRMPFPVIADPERRLGLALSLPTFVFQDATFYKRVTLVAEEGRIRIVKVFYPIFPPDRHAADVVAWFQA